MLKRVLISTSFIILVIAMGMVLLLNSSPTLVTAQGDSTPTANDAPTSREVFQNFYLAPEEIKGTATWVLDVHDFVSNYPEGFKFTVDVSSSEADITNATVYWSHVPGEQRRLAAVLNEDTGRWVADYEIDQSLPPWLAINYHWRFTDENGNTYQTEWFMGDEYADNTREWTRIEDQDIIIFLQEGLDRALADESLAAMEAQRETYRTAWGDLLSYKPRVVLFKDQDTFNEWRQGFVQRSDVITVGQTSGSWGATVQLFWLSDVNDLAWGTVLHEIAHLYQSEFTRRAGLAGATGWWTEGQATYFELHQQYDYEQRVRGLAKSGQLEALMEGSGPNPGGSGPDGRVRYGYDVGYTFFVWLTDNYGLDGHREVMDMIRNGSSRDEALESVTGMTILEIEQAWRVWLGAGAEVPRLIPTPTIEFRLPPTQAPFSSPTPTN